MRIFTAIIVSFLGIAGANAADLGSYRYSGRSSQVVVAGPLVIYDFEPGTVARAYWLPPFGDRYFPAAEGKVRSGRSENLKAPRLIGEPPPEFYRSWSNGVTVLQESPPLPPQK